MTVYANIFATQPAGNVLASKLDDNFIVAANAVTAVNVKNSPYNAAGDGATDDTAAIQAALTAAGASGVVYFPAGQYNVSATLTGYVNQQIIGAGANSTILYRTGNYGDTLVIGTGAGALAAGAARVQGIWFKHSTAYTTGDASLANLAATGAHLRLACGQYALVQDCVFWRLPYGVWMNGCSISKIERCGFLGIWDYTSAPLQEGVAQIVLDNTTVQCQIIVLRDNFHSGAVSVPRSVTYTASDRSQTKTVAEDIGTQAGVLVYGCEDLVVEGSYFGGMDNANILSSFKTGTSNLDWRIIGNYFDGARNTQINFTTQDGTLGLRNLVIAGNVFNGEDCCYQGVLAYNSITPATPIITNYTITGNTFNNHVGSNLVILSAKDGIISGNSGEAWNNLNVSLVDQQWTSFAYCDNSTNVNFFNNNCGGLGSYCYDGIGFGASNTNVKQYGNINGGCTRFNTQSASQWGSALYTNGDFGVGTGAAIATNAIAGFLLIPSCAGTPTGVPANYGAGNIPLVADTTNHKLYFYDGTWRDAGP